MARFYLLRLVKAGQPKESAWPPGRFWNPGHQNSLWGAQVSLPLLVLVSWHVALSQPMTHLETWEGWVWLQFMVGLS